MIDTDMIKEHCSMLRIKFCLRDMAHMVKVDGRKTFCLGDSYDCHMRHMSHMSLPNEMFFFQNQIWYHFPVVGKLSNCATNWLFEMWGTNLL